MGRDEQYGKRHSAGCCTQMFRGFMILVNFCMIVGAGIVVGFGAYTQAVSDDELTNVCKSCNAIVIFVIALFGTLLLFSALGLMALWKRNRCLLCVYGLYLVGFMLGSLAITIVFLMVREGKFDDTMLGVWNDEVNRDDTSHLCSLQEDMKCTGWNSLCYQDKRQNGTNVTNTSFDVFTYYRLGEEINNGTGPGTGCPICTQQQEVDFSNFTMTCRKAFDNDIDKWYEPIIVVGFSLAGLALFSIYVTYKVFRSVNRSSDDGGKYERF